jgi:hypothetical protein
MYVFHDVINIINFFITWLIYICPCTQDRLNIIDPRVKQCTEAPTQGRIQDFKLGGGGRT